jgi:DNA-binding NtrC family response regulator
LSAGEGKGKSTVYQITSRSGVTRGSSWHVSTKPLVMGRGLTCDVCIADPSVSRRHCEIFVEEDQIHLRDLGSSNNTLVNGAMVQECVLHAGDEIGIGGELFIVTKTSQSNDDEQRENPDAATLSISESDSGYLGQPGMASRLEGRPKTVPDLLFLFNISREFSRATSISDLQSSLFTAAVKHFKSPVVWICRYHSGPDAFVFYSNPANHASKQIPQPLDLMRETLRTARGIMKSVRNKRSPGAAPVLVMAAPIQVGGQVLGVIAVQGPPESPAFDETDLEFLIALANTVAPFITSTENAERLRIDNERLRDRAGQSTRLVGTSGAIERVRTQVQDAANSQLSVLISGETGTGKELVSRMIHDLSSRASAPFVVLNCAAIPRELFESELFGHEKGAFTGAVQRKIGRLEQAHGGTVFFDEMGDLSGDNQARLLRVIEDGAFHRVGATEETHVNFRAVCATNKDLRTGVERGEFRSDLFHRINGFEIQIPPLRERPEDIAMLAEYFFELGRSHAKHPVLGFSRDAIEELQKRAWPGNVRQLRLCVYRAIATAKHDYIRPCDFIDEDSQRNSTLHSVERVVSLSIIEQEHIARILRSCSGNVSAAARVLEISRNTLYNKIAEYGIEI